MGPIGLVPAAAITGGAMVTSAQAERELTENVGEQREEIVENLFRMRFRSSGDAIQSIKHRASTTGCGRCDAGLA
jgi:hypothetical protein